MKLHKKIFRKSLMIFVILLYPNLSSAQSCFFSVTADTVLLVESFYSRIDSSNYEFVFYVKDRQSMRAVEVKRTTRWIIHDKYYRVVFDSVKKYKLMDESNEMEWNKAKPYSVNCKAHKLNFLGRGRGAC